MSTVGELEQPAGPVGPCSVYRLYDTDGGLLYVGVANHLPRRLAQHERTQPWWRDVASVSVEHHPTRSGARVAEQAAMDLEAPMHNLSRSVGKTPLHSFRVDTDLWNAARDKAQAEGTTIADVLRAALKRYVRSKR